MTPSRGMSLTTKTGTGNTPYQQTQENKKHAQPAETLHKAAMASENFNEWQSEYYEFLRAAKETLAWP